MSQAAISPDRQSKVDALFAKWDKPGSPGCALAVIQDGAILYQRGYGLADLERDSPITPASIFDIGSTGKQFTATLILILARQGLLSLDDSLRTHVPEMPAYAERITLRHLVHHTSGLRDYLELISLAGMKEENLYEQAYLLNLISRQQDLVFPPGEQFLYSNSGYFMLGIVAERLTGKHITELIQGYIFKPLGMQHSTFNKDYRPIVKNRALSYDAAGDETFTNALALSGGFGDGAILTNIPDLLRWDQNFYTNRLNNSQPDLLEQLQCQGSLNDGTQIEYAGGLIISQHRGLKMVLHGGGWAGYRSELVRFPDQRFSVICLANLGDMDPTTLALQVAEIYLEQHMQAVSPEAASAVQGEQLQLPLERLQAKTGVFVDPLTGETWILLVQDGKLHRQWRSQPRPLAALGPDHFQLANHPVCIEFIDDAHLVYRVAEMPPAHFERQASQPFIPVQLTQYCGDYFSPELEVVYRLSEQDGKLVVQPGTGDSQPLYPALPDLFIGAVRLKFNRNAAGVITGFEASVERVRNIHFDRRK